MAEKQQPEEGGAAQVIDSTVETSVDEALQANEDASLNALDGSAEQDQTEADETASDQSPEQTREELLLTLQNAEAKADEHWNQLLRAQAEMANMQRRAERELENAHKFGLEKLIRELLPIKDSMEMGLTTAEDEELEPVKVREGMVMTLKMFADAVVKFGVTELNPVGEPFNPDFHQAMTTQPAGEGVATNTVLTVFQKGYLLNDRLIRPAMVVVAK